MFSLELQGAMGTESINLSNMKVNTRDKLMSEKIPPKCSFLYLNRSLSDSLKI